MKSGYELKTLARAQMHGKMGVLIPITLIGYAINLVLNITPENEIGAIICVLVCLASVAYTLGVSWTLLKMTRGEAISVGDAFYGFSDFWTAVKAFFFLTLFTTLWSFLFIIPGFVKSFSYSMTWFILAENKGMPVLEAITRSRKMMDGRKMDLFLLVLSFIGWFLLTALTLGIAGLWVYPYCYSTLANFYQSVKEEYLARGGR